MAIYTAKTVEDALAKASEELGISVENLNYAVLKEEKKLFSKKVEVEVYTMPDVISYCENYIKIIVADLGFDCEVTSTIEEGIIKMTINTSHNSILIGKNGQTLQALNSLVRQASGHKFKKHYRILLDINSYKDEKYEKLIRMSTRIAHEVQSSKVNATLDPMTSDERRVVHNALSNIEHIRTESSGQGYKRQITIYYVE
ncbi:MAG: R3H domain-containing nucleic acid-binding protein [Bacilli bacterium]|jgi:spoIIIJ-associated protein|nr:Jag N-terminal domain-containing protein [Bacilli bacterium]MDD3421921.1 Jag N-terminal domain-containing protein [Bacilli bacterium]MDD4065722.1 Jag N-terminal domain-containing protein [Bacilli bacterium]